MTKPPTRNRNASGGAEAFKTKNQSSMRSYFKADGTQAQVSKYRLIWGASIKPAPLMLVLLAMAHFSDSDGSNIFPAMATVAGMCSLSAKQARRHIQTLVGMGVLILAVERISKGGKPTRYGLNLEVLASLNPPANGRVEEYGQPSHAGTSTLPPVTLNPPTDGSQPTLPTLPSNVGEGVGLVPGPSARHRPPAEVQLPPWLDAAALNKALAINPKRDRIALVETAEEYRAVGASADAINAELVNLGMHIYAYKVRLSVARPSAPVASKKRTTARARALVIDPGRDTRAAGRNYELPGVKP